ncbi:MAG: hypothetical protein ACN6OP_01125 [Pseudomonadales bacterium]
MTVTPQGRWIEIDEKRAMLFGESGNKLAFRTYNEICTLEDLLARLRAGEKGDDVPICMEGFGCDYDEACRLVFTGNEPSPEAIERLLTAANGAFLYGTIKAPQAERAFLESLGVELGGYNEQEQLFYARASAEAAFRLSQHEGDFPAMLHERHFDLPVVHTPDDATPDALRAETSFIDFQQSRSNEVNNWQAQRRAVTESLQHALQRERASLQPARLYVEAGSKADGPHVEWAVIDVTPELLQRVLQLREACIANQLLSVRATGGPSRWNRAKEWRPDIPALIVSPGEFWFDAQPKLDSMHPGVETASVPIDRLLQLLQQGERHNSRDFSWFNGALYYANADAEWLRDCVADSDPSYEADRPDLAA